VSKKTRRTPCKRGERYDKKTGKCEPNKAAAAPAPLAPAPLAPAPLAPAPSKDKIINKKTGGKVNDTPLNRAKNEKFNQSLKKGGKNTRKNTKKNTIKKVYKLKKQHRTFKSKK
jgi:hypothetical protein